MNYDQHILYQHFEVYGLNGLPQTMLKWLTHVVQQYGRHKATSLVD